MAENKRADILARIIVVAKTIVAPNCVYRNVTDVPETRRPAIVMLDGDETADESAYGRKRPSNGPVEMILKPELFILCSDLAELETTQHQAIKAFLTDSSLVARCHDGDIRYLGLATGLGVGRSMEFECGLDFEFRYMLRPDRL